MAQQLYFSRDTRMFVQFRNTTTNTEADDTRGGGALWEIPVLDGYSFSQTTNTSEIALSEMESSAGISRRGRRMFTDSLAPAEWSFSTYARPFKSVGQTALGTASTGTKGAEAGGGVDVHAVEEVLWASMFGADTYTTGTSTFTRGVQAVSGPVITPSTTESTIGIAESNRSALHSFVLYFLIDTATANPLLYRMPEAIVNEASVDFDVDGIATINWSGFAKEIQDNSSKLSVSTRHDATVANGRVGGTTNLVVGDLVIDTGNSRAVHIVTNVASTQAVVTQAIDEAVTSTKNFIRNRLTGVTIETADGADKAPGTFPGQHATISAIDNTNKVFTTSTAHGFKTGDKVLISGCEGNTGVNDRHLFVRVGDETGTYAGTTNATTKFSLFTALGSATENGALRLGNASLLDSGTYTGTYTTLSGTAANGLYSLTLTGGSFNLGNNITYLVPEELGAINKPLEHVTGTRTATGNATCYLTLEDTDTTNGTSRQFFNDLVGTGAMAKVVNKFKVTMDVGGTAAAADTVNPAFSIIFPTAHIEVPSHSIEDVISLETTFTALPTDFGAADEITSVIYRPPATY
jgi:hypothetical protein